MSEKNLSNEEKVWIVPSVLTVEVVGTFVVQSTTETGFFNNINTINVH
jgi:hypothetical protein